MVRSLKGRNTIACIPRERILTESDGPFIKMGSRTIEPTDVQTVEAALATIWGMSAIAVRRAVRTNFQKLVVPLKIRPVLFDLHYIWQFAGPLRSH